MVALPLRPATGKGRGRGARQPPVAMALADIPAIKLTEQEATDLRHGQALSLVGLMGRIPDAADPDGGLVRAMLGTRVISLCLLEDGMMKPERTL